jgi:orotate phosphoribosyltransferase
MTTAKTALTTSLYQIGAIQFGEFTLKSGQTSSIYINLRKIISYPNILRDVAALMWNALSQSKFDLVCGVPYTALPIATCLSLDHNLPMVMRRKEKKDYGTKQLIEGEFQSGQRCLVIEDVITTGGSIIETATDLQQAGIVIDDVVVLIDREQGGRQNLEKHFNVYSVLTMSEILDTLLASEAVDQNEKSIIEKFIKERVAS